MGRVSPGMRGGGALFSSLCRARAAAIRGAAGGSGFTGITRGVMVIVPPRGSRLRGVGLQVPEQDHGPPRVALPALQRSRRSIGEDGEARKLRHPELARVVHTILTVALGVCRPIGI